MEAIRKQGILKMNRHHVHLSENRETALKVGLRREDPVVIDINCLEMIADGFEFFLSENQVWLLSHVPLKYLNFKSRPCPH